MKDSVTSCYIIDAFSAYCLDETIRAHSSSGGIFTLLANLILNDQGVVFGAAYDSAFKVNHIGINKAEDISKLRGAKYCQSNMTGVFEKVKNLLDSGIPVLFSGTPCQVAGLKHFIKKDYINLFCVDFVCHGVPLSTVWESYVQYRAKRDDSGNLPQSINLRSKHTGWRNYRYSNVYEYKDGRQYTALSGQDLYMRLFTGDYINQKGCSNCHFKGYSRGSDITLGDFWGIWDIAPEMDDNKGTSLIMVQSEKGLVLWEKIQLQTKWKRMTLEEASRRNPSILYSSKAKPNRDEVIKLCLDGEWDKVEEMLPKPEFPRESMVLKTKLKHAIKKIFMK